MNFVILGPPRTKKNSLRIFKHGSKTSIVPSNRCTQWTASAIRQLREQDELGVPIAEPVNLRALVYRDKLTGDLINYLQAVCDALEDAGIVENDKYIVSLDGSRMFKDRCNPRVEILILRSVQEVESKRTGEDLY
jgi:Holliday junction resolvase RusA-like endonuclease